MVTVNTLFQKYTLKLFFKSLRVLIILKVLKRYEGIFQKKKKINLKILIKFLV